MDIEATMDFCYFIIVNLTTLATREYHLDTQNFWRTSPECMMAVDAGHGVDSVKGSGSNKKLFELWNIVAFSLLPLWTNWTVTVVTFGSLAKLEEILGIAATLWTAYGMRESFEACMTSITNV